MRKNPSQPAPSNETKRRRQLVTQPAQYYPPSVLRLDPDTLWQQLLSLSLDAAGAEEWAREATALFATLAEVPGSEPGTAASGQASTLRLEPKALRRELVALGADPVQAERLTHAAATVFAQLTKFAGIEASHTIDLPLTPQELSALHALLLAAYHDPGSGAFVGPTLRDWRDHLDTLHRKTIALVERHDTPQPHTPPGP